MQQQHNCGDMVHDSTELQVFGMRLSKSLDDFGSFTEKETFSSDYHLLLHML